MPWTNDDKDWEYARPFHRIGSPSYQPGADPVDGLGYLRGCHSPDDGPSDSLYGSIIQGLARTLPGWVPVAGEKEQELEGTLERSFQTWTDVPLYQFHRYYDWNFHIVPADGYDYVRGQGNRISPEVIPGKMDRFMTPKSMECEWDCGTFGGRRESPGVMFNNPQWIWPMTDQYCWVAGRFIYDCGHATSENKAVGKMRSEIHPVKAMATAQWEALKFPENGGLYVPGIRFLFFASRLGGYHDFPTIKDHDYKFIVDLPKNPGITAPWRIGHTPDFPFNTGAFRTPHLLHRPEYLTVPSLGGSSSLEPIIEPIPAKVPGQLPEQVKVTIPLSQLSGNAPYYGVILNLGWFDPDQSQARKVKRCSVRFHHFHKGRVNHDQLAEEWLLKFGANGRWYSHYFDSVKNGHDYQLDMVGPDFYLADGDSVRITSHGAEMDRMDDVFQRSIDDRTLKLSDDSPAQWERDIVAGTSDPEHNGEHEERLWAFVYEVAGMLPGTDAILNKLGIEDGRANNPLGMIDPLPADNPDHQADNPLKVDGMNLEKVRQSLVAYYAQEMGESAELVEHRNRVDYILYYDLTVKPQLV